MAEIKAVLMAYSKGIFFLENNTYIKQSEFSLCQCYFQFWVIPISGFPTRKRLEETKSAKECKEEKQNADTPKKREKKRHRETHTHTHAGKSCSKRNIWRNKAVLWRKS